MCFSLFRLMGKSNMKINKWINYAYSTHPIYVKLASKEMRFDMWYKKETVAKQQITD